MKKPLLLILALLAALPAFADQASKDPAVHALRQQFSEARNPRAEDLQYGRHWVCTYHSVISGSHSTSYAPDYYQFVRGTQPTRVSNEHDFQAPVFQFTEKSLRGEYSNSGKTFAIDRVRVDSKGELIVEYAQPRCSGFECVAMLFTDRSDEDSLSAVIGYRHCTLQNNY